MDFVSWRKQAQLDFRKIIEYTEQEWGVSKAAETLVLFEEALLSLIDSPLAGRKPERNHIRVLTLSKLPFVIVYQIKGREIIVRKIIHTSRNR